MAPTESIARSFLVGAPIRARSWYLSQPDATMAARPSHWFHLSPPAHPSTHASEHEALLHADRGRTMRKLLLVGVVTISLSNFGTCWAQSTASPPQIQPPAKTAPAKASHSSRSSVQQFKTEADAKSHCGTDQVVWGNTSSHALHYPGTKYYGKTTHGAYMCKGLAVNAGYHESKE